jgi:hypothetical protein
VMMAMTVTYPGVTSYKALLLLSCLKTEFIPFVHNFIV